jgi:hypothetical protein
MEGDEGTSEGLILCLPDAVVSEEGDPDLEHRIQFLDRTLPRLSNLTELCVQRPKDYEVERYPVVAERLALAIHSLRYINGGTGCGDGPKDYWRIVRYSQPIRGPLLSCI